MFASRSGVLLECIVRLPPERNLKPLDEPNAQSISGTVPKEAKVGGHVSRGDASEHPPPRPRAEDRVMREYHVTEEVDSLREFSQDDLPGMDGKPPVSPEPLHHRWKQRTEDGGVVVEDKNVVGVPEIVPETESFFAIVVESVQICIGEQL